MFNHIVKMPRLGAVATAVAAVFLSTSAVYAGTLEVLVVDRDGKPTPDAVVAVYPTGKGMPKTPLPGTAMVNQEKQQFVPKVTVVAMGAKVRFTNSDPWNHHVRLGVAGAPRGDVDGQSILLEGKAEGKPPSSAVLTFDKPGAHGAALLGCYIHSSMKGTVYVAESPWTVKTGPDGMATLEDVPEGAATVKVWHVAQLVDKTPLETSVSAAPTRITFRLNVVSRGSRL